MELGVRDYYFYIEPLTNFHPPDPPVENAVDDVGKYLTCLYSNSIPSHSPAPVTLVFNYFIFIKIFVA